MSAEPFTHGAAETAPTSSIATAMLFGSVIFATTGLAARTWLTGDNRAVLTALYNPRSAPLNTRSYISVYTFLHHTTVLGLILFFAYVCEYHPPYPHSEKSYDRDEFFFLVALLFLVSAWTVHRNDGGGGGGVRKGGAASPSKGGGGRASSVVSGGGSVVKGSGSVSLGGTVGDDDGGGGGGTSTNGDGTADGASTVASGMTSAYSGYSGGSTSATQAQVAVPDVGPANDVLNRDQTEEWKGWMQFIFLLYHYYHAEEVYNSIRIMITCYVWMTGFGNFSFFYLKGDYSLVRVLQMLWRLNFLVVFLCLSQGTTYILYYICPLHTYFFLMVYGIMRVGKRINYTKYGLRLKMGVCALIIFAFWDLDSGLFRLVHLPILGQVPVLGATGGTMWEWYFRTTLDHWSTFLGMVFALNYPITSLFFRKLEAQPSRYSEWLGKGAVGGALLGCLYAWITGPFLEGKIQYNATNAYFGFVPLITYIYFRNLTPTLREYSLDLLHQIGKTTLETYLMQHHIWLTSNAKSLLVLIPGWPRVNFLLVTTIYFFTSRRLYRLTLYLRGMLMPDNRAACIKSLLGMGIAIGSFFGLALTLEAFGQNNLVAVAIVCVVCGFLLYQTVLDWTYKAYRDTCPPVIDTDGGCVLDDSVVASAAPDSSIARLSPPLIGTMVLLIIGMTWHGLAETGAGKIGPLRAECDAHVNDGRWVVIDGCNEASRGEGYRDYGTASFATCGPMGGTYVWGWNATRSYTHCRFARRDAKSLKKSLNHRTLVFVGDSMTRNVYHATLRILGVTGSGSYDATGPKHADMHNSIGSVKVDFRWAPLAGDQFTALKEINDGAGEKPDLIFVGGGAWDRLHQFATDQDQETLKGKLGELAKEMSTAKEGGSPVAWLVPTTINDPALNTEEKRDHMTEEHMEEMRELHGSRGILSASSFVLDGPAFTADRVRESYDGVHYPPQVYDAGAQILANAMDWLLPERDTSDPWNPLQPGRMANPFLGLMMLCFVFVGLMFFDGFMGFSYLASLFVRGVMPNDLYEEAFAPLHRKMKLPAVKMSSRSSAMSVASSTHGGSRRSSDASESVVSNLGPDIQDQQSVTTNASTVDEEIAALLGEKR